MQYYVSPTGSDTASGTSEGGAFRSLAAIKRLPAGVHTVTLMPGSWREPLPLRNGLTVQAKEPGQSILSGAWPTALAWARDSSGIWSAPDPGGVFGVFLGTFESAGSYCCAYDGAYAKFDPTRPGGKVIPGSKAQWQAMNGRLLLTSISGGDPKGEGVVITRNALAISATGLSDVHLSGIATRHWRRAFEAIGGKNITLDRCDFRYSSTTAVGLGPVDGIEWTGCTIYGGGSLLGHYEDIIHVESGVRAKFSGCDIAWGGHGLVFFEKGGAFQVLGCYLHDSGGSGITLVRNVNGAVIEGCWLERCATQHSPSVRDVGSAFQVHGDRHRVTNCLAQNNSKHVLLSATGPGTDNPTTNDNLFERCSFLAAEEMGVEGQEAGPAGRIERNTWRDCIVKSEVALFYAGVGDRNSNKLVNCQVVGNTRGVVLEGSGPNPRPNTGSTLTAPPTPDGSTPPDPPVPPDPPPTPGRPLLRALTPSSGPPGAQVTATGENLADEFLVPVPTGARRLTGVPGSATSRTLTMPQDVVTGEVRARNGSRLSDPLTFTVTGTPPDPPDPPDPPQPGKLDVSVALSPSGAFSGTVRGRVPLPPGSTLTVVAVTPDGWEGNGEAKVGEAPPPPVPGDPAAEVVGRTNQARVENGLPPLTINAQLAAAAVKHASWMAANNRLDHTGEGGSSPGQRIAAEGYRASTWGENVASGYSNPESVMVGWMSSPGHRANLLGAQFREIGVGVARSAQGRLFWTQVFGARVAGLASLAIAEGHAPPPLIGPEG